MSARSKPQLTPVPRRQGGWASWFQFTSFRARTRMWKRSCHKTAAAILAAARNKASMPKQFYTEKDIEDLVQRGTRSLQLTDEIVLTELAYEKAQSLGLQLITNKPDTPPAAPVRPYLSDGQTTHAKPVMGPVSQTASQAAIPPTSSPEERENTSAIEQRIRSAVIARLGNQVDAKLLDNIIQRVVKSTGLK